MRYLIILICFVYSANIFSQETTKGEFIDIGFNFTTVYKDFKLNTYGGHIGYVNNFKSQSQ